ncbi:hypothetical protein vseg_020312 [Gypsophila vaccaria]
MCLIENNGRHGANPCIQKGPEVSSTKTDDRLTELPKDLVLSILSSFTTKEVRQISVVSQKWNKWLLGYYPKLNFEGSKAIKESWFEIRFDDDELAKERSIFVNQVDRVMNQHLDSSIDEFRVVFDLDNRCQSHVDRWVSFALKKHVRTIELNFDPVYIRMETDRCGLTIKEGVNHSLTSLRLICVNITSEDIESVLLLCPFLENLYIIYSEVLTSIKPRASLVSLKHFDVSDCYKLETIDISAPKMVYFRYLGQPIELNLRDAISLSSVFIGAEPMQHIRYAFKPLSKYFPQLEALYLQIPIPCVAHQYTRGIELLRFSLLTTLKVLDLCIRGDHTSSLLAWTPLIEACPALEKLTVKLQCYDSGLDWNELSKRRGSPLKSLKTLELLGYTGRRLDIEFAAFIFENAINLREVIVQVGSYSYSRGTPLPPARLSMLKEIVPQGVTFILMD